MAQGPLLRKYGAATTVNFDLFEIDGIDFRVDAVGTTGDIKIMKDEGAEANTASLFVDEGQGYSLALNATEMTCARAVVYLVDSATKAWLDKSIIVETYGNASAQHAFDFDDANGTTLTEAGGDGDHLNEAGGDGDHLTAINLPNQTMDITGSLSGSVGSVAAEVTASVNSIRGTTAGAVNFQAMYDGTGYVGGSAKLTVDVSKISGDSTAADNAELMFDGTGYAGGSTNLKVDAVAISGDATAANNAELFFDGTGYAGGSTKLNVNIASSDNIDFGATMKASINTEADNAILTYGLDHLLQTSVTGTDVANNSIIAKLVDDAATADWDGYDPTTASLEALNVDTDALVAGVVTNAQGADVATDVAAMIDGNNRVDVGSWLGTAVTSGTGGPDVNVNAVSDDTTAAATLELFVEAVDQSTGQIDSGSFATGAITAGAIATDAIGAAELAADAATEIANAVWDTDATGRQTGGTFGQAIGDPGANAETMYDAVVTDAAGTNVAVDVVAVIADTEDIQNRIPSSLVSGRIDATIDATGMESGAITAILTAQMTEAYAANGVAPTLAQAIFAVHQMLMQFGISGTAYTVRKLDDSTTAFVVTLDDATSPTDAKRV